MGKPISKTPNILMMGNCDNEEQSGTSHQDVVAKSGEGVRCLTLMRELSPVWTNGLTERMRRRGKGKAKSNGTRTGHGYHSGSDNGLSRVTGAGTINKIRDS